MAYREEKPVSWTVKFLFPFMVVLFAGILAPISVPLIGALMFGNMLKVSGVCDSLSDTAQNELSNLVTLFLGITVGATMTAENILTLDVLKILALGAVAFVFDTVGGVLFAKVVNLFLKKKINPMIGACGISAFPMRQCGGTGGIRRGRRPRPRTDSCPFIRRHYDKYRIFHHADSHRISHDLRGHGGLRGADILSE